MKGIYFMVALLCFAISCRKQVTEGELDYMEVVKNDLRQRMSTRDFSSLDFSNAHLSTGDSGRLLFLQVPFKYNDTLNQFVLLKTNFRGHVESGKIIQLILDNLSPNNPGYTINLNQRCPDGRITIRSLESKVEVISPIKSGFIESFHDNSTKSGYISHDTCVESPEVIIVSSYPSSNGIKWSTWFCVIKLLDWRHKDCRACRCSWYAPSVNHAEDVVGGGTNPITTLAGALNAVTSQMIYIRPETEVKNAGINLHDYLHCFAAIPDTGATCKISIFADLPVNGDPTKFFDFGSGSPGHTFLRLQKSNAGQFSSQYIGFYPATDWKTILTTEPIPGKFEDNTGHEFDASYELEITPAQLETGVTRMLHLDQFVQYDIDDYNCTDWAIDVFNHIVQPDQRLIIIKYYIPGGMTPYGTSTPQGLYTKLRSMAKKGEPGVVLRLMNWASKSTGPC